jgi:CheY-like chemotaxis protein
MSTRLAVGPNRTVNLDALSILLVEGNTSEMDILVQIFLGFGANKTLRAADGPEASTIVSDNMIDLMIVDGMLPGEQDGFELIRSIRTGMTESRFMPILLILGHTSRANVERARDCGAHFVVAKPIKPGVLFERIAWLAGGLRPFVETETYMGPDRRFKMMGPPPGMDGRRREDLPTDLGAATMPNMSQDDIDAMLKPARH